MQTREHALCSTQTSSAACMPNTRTTSVAYVHAECPSARATDTCHDSRMTEFKHNTRVKKHKNNAEEQEGGRKEVTPERSPIRNSKIETDILQSELIV